MPRVISDEVRYKLLRYIETHPDTSQRELARHLGVSVGKINYCLRALIAKGLLKMRAFRGSKRKIAVCSYVLTAKGIEEKITVTSQFLKRKVAEYSAISAEIERLTRELAEFQVKDKPSALQSDN